MSVDDIDGRIDQGGNRGGRGNRGGIHIYCTCIHVHVYTLQVYSCTCTYIHRCEIMTNAVP